MQEARGPQSDQSARVSKWLAAVAVLVLLIACANAANLMLTAAVQRRREVGVRLALGGGRRRLLRQLFIEHCCLALLAGAASLLIAAWAGPALRAFLLPTLPAESVLDLRVFAATVTVTLASGLLAGLLPAWQGSQVDVASSLKSEARGPQRRYMTRAGLVLAQVALTLTLLASAGLFLRSLRKVRGLDLGLDLRHVLRATMDLQKSGRSLEDANSLYLRMVERLTRIPGVERVAASVGHPFGYAQAMSVTVPRRDSVPQLPGGGPYYSQVTPGYFEATGTEIVRGRGFREADGAGSSKVTVISQTTAKLLWPGQDPVGHCVKLGSARDCYQVVGVAKDAARFSAVEPSAMYLYVPMGQWEPQAITALFVRARGDPDALVSTVRREMQGLAPDLPFANVMPLRDLGDRTIRPWQLGATLFSLMGVLALAVAAAGLYGVLNYLVSQRTHEIGVRMALGADAGSVVRLVVGEGVRMTVLGLFLGLVGAYVAGRAERGRGNRLVRRPACHLTFTHPLVPQKWTSYGQAKFLSRFTPMPCI